MVKKNSSYRIEEAQLEMLDRLVEYYQQTSSGATSLNHIKVSKATVLESLITDRYNEIFSKASSTSDEVAVDPNKVEGETWIDWYCEQCGESVEEGAEQCDYCGSTKLKVMDIDQDISK